MVAAEREIDLKKLAARWREETPHGQTRRSEALTGLQVGGISALALLSKPFEVCLDRPALELERIH